MTNPSVNEILAVLMAEDRAPEERLASLASLRDFLKEADVALALGTAARTEKSLPVRKAMMAAFLAVDITRFTDKDAYLGHVFYFAEREQESSLRLLAVIRLAELAPADARLQPLLVETLRYDLNEKIQRACLAGLSQCPQKSPEAVQALIDYASQAPRALRELLLPLFGQFERKDMERGLLALLHPLESDEARSQIIERLSRFPVLSPAVTEGLVDYLPREPKAAIQARLIEVLFSAIQADAANLQVVLERVRVSPDQAALLFAFRERLFSFPAFVDGLQKLFVESPSVRVKLEILKLLDRTESVTFFTRALSDANPWVRFSAIDWCERHVQKYPDEIAAAAAARIPEEPLPELRSKLTGLFRLLGRKSSAVERFLVQWMSREPNPLIAETLAAALPDVAVSDDNRQDLLKAFVRILKEPFFNFELKKAVTEKLKAFSYENQPDLKECLKALMRRATDLKIVEPLYASLRTLEPDPARLLDVTQPLFLRFIGDYPQEPLDQWLKDFGEMAPSNEAVRREIPYLVKLTGASWLLKTVEVQDQKANVLPAILEALRGAEIDQAKNLLKEAYDKNALRKRDLLELFQKLLNMPDRYPLLDETAAIMNEQGVSSPELLDLCFRFLTCFPESQATYQIKTYLEKGGIMEMSYPERLEKAMTQDNYRAYALACTSPKDQNGVPRTWDDSGHWRVMYPEWPVAGLYVASEPWEHLHGLLGKPLDLDTPVFESLHYLLLNHLWRRHEAGETELALLGELIRRTKNEKSYAALYDRALFTFYDFWPRYIEKMDKKPIPQNLAQYAAEAYAEQCRHWARRRETVQDPAILPLPLPGLDFSHFDQAWVRTPQALEELWALYAAYVAPDKKSAPPVEDARPLDFAPLSGGDGIRQVIQFLLRTSPPADPVWEDRWKNFFRALRKEDPTYLGRLIEREMAKVPEVQRRRLLTIRIQ